MNLRAVGGFERGIWASAYYQSGESPIWYDPSIAGGDRLQIHKMRITAYISDGNAPANWATVRQFLVSIARMIATRILHNINRHREQFIEVFGKQI
jgi:hypothetical protein